MLRAGARFTRPPGSNPATTTARRRRRGHGSTRQRHRRHRWRRRRRRGSTTAPRIANADQHDHDGDGRGDACDVCPHLVDAGGDADGDGVGDACDPRPTDAGDRIALFEGFYDQVAGRRCSAARGRRRAAPCDETDTVMQHQIVTGGADLDQRVHRRPRQGQLGREPQSVAPPDRPRARLPRHRHTTSSAGSRRPAAASRSRAGASATGSTTTTTGYVQPQMPSDWTTIQARTIQAPGDVHPPRLRAADVPTGSDDDTDDAVGDIGLRINGAAASFDYVFVVESPPPA